MARIAGPVLHTPRLRLAVPKPRDVPDIYRWMCDTTVTRNLMWDGPASPQDILDFVHAMAREQRRGESLVYVLHDRETDTPIGCCGAHHLTSDVGFRPEIGYWLARPYWGRGLAPEAVGALVGQVFGAVRLARLSGQVFEDNRRSARVLERLGFRYEGMLRHSVRKAGRYRTVHLYGLLRTDPAAKRLIKIAERA